MDAVDPIGTVWPASSGFVQVEVGPHEIPYAKCRSLINQVLEFKSLPLHSVSGHTFFG
jgi:hypothetical protein